MNINFQNQSNEASWDAYQRYCKPILKKTLALLKKDDNVEVGIVLVNDAAIHAYNKQFRNVDQATDVLSFVDGTTVDDILQLGDIMMSVDAIRRQAEAYGHSLKREFCFLMVHGYLHLLGYDHQTAPDEKEMFQLQEDILDGIAHR